MHTKVKNLCYIALFAALIAVCTWITVPGAVPFTMQTFAVFCALATLGGKGGTISILIYIVLGDVGVPGLHPLRSTSRSAAWGCRCFRAFAAASACSRGRPAGILSVSCLRRWSPGCSSARSVTA